MTITPAMRLDAIARLEALIEVYRANDQHEQALICVTRLLKLLGVFPAELDLSDDDPLWAVSTPNITDASN